MAVANWCATTLAPQRVAGVRRARAASAESALRYGENPHQQAALYLDPAAPAGLAQAEQLHGKEMSYNNYVDADAAWRSANDFTEPCVAIIKHANPCGIAIGADVAEAHRKAHACDPVSAFGGVIAVNREVTAELAKQLDGIFTEVIVAPSFAAEALDGASARRRTCACWSRRPGARRPPRSSRSAAACWCRSPTGSTPTGDDPANWTLATGEAASAEDAARSGLRLAGRSASVKSNAILLAHDGATVGVGMGQVNRVDSAQLAVDRAGADRAKGSVAASDAFFPFPDGLEVLIAAGVKAVVQPGGSIRDNLVIEAAEKAGLTVYLTGTRHFYH